MGFFVKNLRPPRRFAYEPRYYDPQRDERGRRIRIERLSRARRRKPQALVLLVVLLAAALYVYLGFH